MSEFNWSDALVWIDKSTKLLIKKLSRNDCAWADDPGNGHQNGLYIPSEIRESGFFPALTNTNAEKAHIFDCRFNTIWPSLGELRSSSLKHYSNKGPETHFTRVPKEEFLGLTPASWLIGGTLKEPEYESSYWFAVLDSASTEAEILESTFELNSGFHFGIFDPSQVKGAQVDDAEKLINELNSALKNGTLPEFISRVSAMPHPNAIAAEAQGIFLAESGQTTLDPYELERPGDAIMSISRDIEYRLYKRAELRRRASEVVHILSEINTKGLAASVVNGFSALDATFLSASQQRKSRAGLSFERHVGSVLRAGRIKFEEQAILGGRRPDFVLPSIKELNKKSQEFDDALILSLKTTIRERWKQVKMEKFNSAIFLATVDDRVAGAAIDDMGSHGICLVVPESLKASKETCYPEKGNVISFRDFFDDEVSIKRPFLRIA